MAALPNVPMNKDDESNLYDSNEHDLSTILFTNEKGSGSSARINDQLGRVQNSQGKALSVEAQTRRIKIGEHRLQVEDELKKLEEIKTKIVSLSKVSGEVREELEAYKVSLKKIGEGNAAEDNLLKKMEEILVEYPGVLMRLQARGYIVGAPSQAENDEIFRNVNDALDTYASLDERLIESERKNLELQRRLEAQDENTSHRNPALDVEKMALIAELVGISFGPVLDWPTGLLEDATSLARILEARPITPNAIRWMESLRMTQPANNGRSAREQALWLLSKAHKKELDFSLADLHQLVSAINNAPHGVMADTLAFLHHFVISLVRLVKAQGEEAMTDDYGCNVNCALMILRSMELLLLHLADGPTAYRLDSITIYQEVAPLLVAAAKDSRLVRGLEGLVGGLLTSNRTISLASVLQNEASLLLDNKRLMSSGDDLILIEGDHVHLIRSNKHTLEMDTALGLRFVVTDYPSVGDVWRSSWVGHDNLTILTANFASFCDRSADMYEMLDLDAHLANFQIGA